jgi:hypothetical protein
MAGQQRQTDKKKMQLHVAFSCPSGSDSSVKPQLYANSASSLQAHRCGDRNVACLGSFGSIGRALRPCGVVNETISIKWKRGNKKLLVAKGNKVRGRYMQKALKCEENTFLFDENPAQNQGHDRHHRCRQVPPSQLLQPA